jgi:hypothetical protein
LGPGPTVLDIRIKTRYRRIDVPTRVRQRDPVVADVRDFKQRVACDFPLHAKVKLLYITILKVRIGAKTC